MLGKFQSQITFPVSCSCSLLCRNDLNVDANFFFITRYIYTCNILSTDGVQFLKFMKKTVVELDHNDLLF